MTYTPAKFEDVAIMAPHCKSMEGWRNFSGTWYVDTFEKLVEKSSFTAADWSVRIFKKNQLTDVSKFYINMMLICVNFNDMNIVLYILSITIAVNYHFKYH